jgi:hypothetical protein
MVEQDLLGDARRYVADVKFSIDFVSLRFRHRLDLHQYIA